MQKYYFLIIILLSFSLSAKSSELKSDNKINKVVKKNQDQDKQNKNKKNDNVNRYLESINRKASAYGFLPASIRSEIESNSISVIPSDNESPNLGSHKIYSIHPMARVPSLPGNYKVTTNIGRIQCSGNATVIISNKIYCK
jgi:hypothetical protein